MNNNLQIYKYLRPLIVHKQIGEVEIKLMIELNSDLVDVFIRIPIKKYYQTQASHVMILPNTYSKNTESFLVLQISVLQEQLLPPLEWLTPEITDLSLGNNVSGELYFVRNSKTIDIFFKPLNEIQSESFIDIKFTLWDAITPIQGLDPFLFRDLGVKFCFPATFLFDAILLINTPKELSPRSTQGNYVLAYPSKLSGSRRKTIMFYSRQNQIEILYRLGWENTIDSPLPLFLKSTLALTLISTIISIFSPEVDKSSAVDVGIVLASSLLTLTLYLKDTVDNNLFKIRIYKTHKALIQSLSVFLFLVISSLYMLTIYFIVVGQNFPIQFKLFCYSITGLMLLFALLGAMSQYYGFLFFYKCDISGCQQILWYRSNKLECKYTGRVPCFSCISNICINCLHYEDLITGATQSLDQFSPDFIPCVKSISVNNLYFSKRKKAWFNFFGSDPYPFDLSYVEKRDQTAIQNKFLEKMLEHTKNPILDAGCGYGRHAQALAESGREVVAVDFVQHNCQVTSQRHSSIRTVCSCLSDLPFESSKFGAVYSMYSSLGYEPELDFKILKELTRVLKSGGILILDLAGAKARQNRTGFDVTHNSISFFVSYFQKRQSELKHYTVSLTKKGIKFHELYIRLYSKQEIENMASELSLIPKSYYGNYFCQPLNNKSERNIFVFEKM